MKIKTWIKYEESYIPPRCRKPRYAEREEYVDINLREATMQDLLPAFKDNSYSGKGTIYFYKGKLWAEAKLPHVTFDEADEIKTALDYLVYCREHCSTYFRIGLERRYGMDTAREAVLNQARKDMSRYLLVDGTLYEQTSEPRYCIYTFGLGHNHGGTSLSVDYYYNPNIPRYCYFPADRGAEAVDEAKRIALRRGDTESVHRFKPEIEVFMPELVKIKLIKRNRKI